MDILRVTIESLSDGVVTSSATASHHISDSGEQEPANELAKLLFQVLKSYVIVDATEAYSTDPDAVLLAAAVYGHGWNSKEHSAAICRLMGKCNAILPDYMRSFDGKMFSP